jgi:hypothetical protein
MLLTSVVILNVIILIVLMLSVINFNVGMLSVVIVSKEPLLRVRLTTIDLLILTRLYQLLFLLKI